MSLSTLSQFEDVQARGAASMIWLRDHLPAALQGMGPWGIAWWQWLSLLLLIPTSALIGQLALRPVQTLLRRLVQRTTSDLDDRLVDATRGPLVLLVAGIASRALVGWIALGAGPLAHVIDLQQSVLTVAVFWALFRVIGVVQDDAVTARWLVDRPALRSLIPLVARVARVLLVLLGLLSVAAVWGYPVGTILAGLGIGGIAIALGAQKTLENVFGSVSIGVDQPFRVGDYVDIDGVEGEVEAVGLRSTRLRTPERTVVSIPNGRLAEMRTENFGERDRFRFRTTIGLEYGLPAAVIERVRDGIEGLLREDPTTWPDLISVRVVALAAASIDVEVLCWVVVPTPVEFRRIRERHLLGIMRVVADAGAQFAFPTQTVHLKPSVDAHTPPR